MKLAPDATGHKYSDARVHKALRLMPNLQHITSSTQSKKTRVDWKL